MRLGFNYRWTDLQAAVGIAQLEKLDRLLELRSAAAERYGELLRDVDRVETLDADDADHRRSWFVYVVVLARELDRDAVMAALRREGVASAEYIPCILLQPYMRRDYGFAEGQFPVAEAVSRPARSRCRSIRRSRRRIRSASSRCSRRDRRVQLG